MITFKIEGLTEMINKLNQETWIEPDKIDAIVHEAAMPVVKRLQQEYSITWGKSKAALRYNKSFDLANSVEAFRRNRKKGEPYFTYYVGPRYTGGKSLVSYGGNAAHLLEYGTGARFRANSSKGGVGKKVKGKKTGLSGVYGAKVSTGYVKAYGIIRRVGDEFGPKTTEFLKSKIMSLITQRVKQLGFQV